MWNGNWHKKKEHRKSLGWVKANWMRIRELEEFKRKRKWTRVVMKRGEESGWRRAALREVRVWQQWLEHGWIIDAKWALRLENKNFRECKATHTHTPDISGPDRHVCPEADKLHKHHPVPPHTQQPCTIHPFYSPQLIWTPSALSAIGSCHQDLL